MANLTEQSIFSSVYQLEKTDPVEAGAGGISNLQAQQLANRTRNLQDQIAALTTLINGFQKELVGEVKVLPYEITGTANLWTSPDGFLYYRPRGASIGSSLSLATVADNRLELLFKALWATPAYTMGGGLPKGASADADWSANRVLLLPDLRGRAVCMAGTATGGAANRAIGTTFGAETTTLAVGNLPSHRHNVSVSNITATGIAGLASSGLGVINNGNPTATSTIQAGINGNRTANNDNLGAIADTGSGNAFSVADPSVALSVVWACGVKA